MLAPEVDQRVLDVEPSGCARWVDDPGLDEVASAFADIVDGKSPYTFRHSANVALYAQEIGAALGVDAGFARRLRAGDATVASGSPICSARAEPASSSRRRSATRPASPRTPVRLFAKNGVP